MLTRISKPHRIVSAKPSFKLRFSLALIKLFVNAKLMFNDKLENIAMNNHNNSNNMNSGNIIKCSTQTNQDQRSETAQQAMLP